MKQEQRIRLEIALATFILILSLAMVLYSAVSISELTSATWDDPMYIQEEAAHSARIKEGAA